MTTSTRLEAQKIVQSLLQERLIACANIWGPMESRYWWRSKIENASEFLVLMKSKQKLFARLVEAVKEMHSYEVPEILAVPIVEGFQPYLKWLSATVADNGDLR